MCWKPSRASNERCNYICRISTKGITENSVNCGANLPAVLLKDNMGGWGALILLWCVCLKAMSTPSSVMGNAKAAKGWAGKFLLVSSQIFLKSPSLLLRLNLIQRSSVLFLLSSCFVFLFKSNLVNSNVRLSCQVHSLVICDGFQSSWWKGVYKSCYFNCMTKGMPSLSWWHAFSFWTLFLSQAHYSVPDQWHSCTAGEEGGVCLAMIPRGIQNSTVSQIWETVCFCLLSKPPSLLKSPRDAAN